jgi:protein-L-isoaspartate(D-aspartate) O-methyltransferase
MTDLENDRRNFAERLRVKQGIRSERLVRAFATVPREKFLGPPPWSVWDPTEWPDDRDGVPYVLESDPAKLYEDVLVAIDRDRGLNNGQPSLWALVYDRIDARPGERIVHIGCGVGYYTAILAELVGAAGSVIGIDIDRDVLSRAKDNLADRPNVRVVECNGADYAEGAADIIVVNAGITHPLAVWLDALNINGRLMVPLTCTGYRPEAGFGAFFCIARTGAHQFDARLTCPTGIFHFAGGRDPVADELLKSAWRKDADEISSVSSLRRDTHDEEPSCWLHGNGYCLSKRANQSVH